MSANAKIDVNFINAFVDATLNVLKIMAGIAAEKQDVFIRQKDQTSGDISAIVGMNSNDYIGSMAIAFEESCFLKVASGMLSENFTQLTPEIRDAAGELCNQIFGMAKKTLNEKGHSIQPAIPSVIVGKNHTINHQVDSPCIAIKFKTPDGFFIVEAVLQGKQ